MENSNQKFRSFEQNETNTGILSATYQALLWQEKKETLLGLRSMFWAAIDSDVCDDSENRRNIVSSYRILLDLLNSFPDSHTEIK